MRKKIPLSVAILTYNEEDNLRACLESVEDWVEEIFIVDSHSSDSTCDIGREFTDKILQHPFENYSKQRNWALENLDFSTEWILNLDADHRVSKDLKKELIEIFQQGIPSEINGFLISRRTIFMGQWIRWGGHYPVYHGALFRRGKGRCEEKLYDQHFLIEGKVKKLEGDIIDIVTDTLGAFIDRHNHWATLEAADQLLGQEKKGGREVAGRLSGHEMEKRRFWRNSYHRLPLLIRPFLYFFYRYFIRLGFLDGKAGLVFHFLQGLWFRFLVDCKIYEMEKVISSRKGRRRDIICETYDLEVDYYEEKE